MYFHYSCHSPGYKCSAERATLFAIDIPLLFAPHVYCHHLDHPIYLGKSKNVSSAENWQMYNVQYSLFFVLEWSWPWCLEFRVSRRKSELSWSHSYLSGCKKYTFWRKHEENLHIVLMDLFTNVTLLHCRNSSFGPKKNKNHPSIYFEKLNKFVKFHKKLLQFQENAAGPQLAIFTMKCICRERQRFSLKFYNGPKLLLIEKKKILFSK